MTKQKAKKQKQTNERPEREVGPALHGDGYDVFLAALEHVCPKCGAIEDAGCVDSEGYTLEDKHGVETVHQERIDVLAAAKRRAELKAPNGNEAELVFDVEAALGEPLKRAAGWLYYLSDDCNVVRSPMVTGGKKGKAKPEVVCLTDISREDGWLYFIGKDGNVWRTRMAAGPRPVDTKGRVLFERRLPVDLTDDELRERGQDLAEKMREIDEAEEQKKAAAARFKEIIDRLSSEASDMARVVRARQETRTVKCFTEHDLEAKQARTVRTDTGAVVETRDLTREEIEDLRQGKLFDEVRAFEQMAATSPPPEAEDPEADEAQS